MNVIVCGANGVMGKLLRDRLGQQAVGLVSIDGENGVAKTFDALGDIHADVVIDFSHHSAVEDILCYCIKNKCAAVIGSTGHSQGELALIRDASKSIPVFYSANMSLGVAVLCRLAKLAAQNFPDADIEIVDIHHNRKADAPSGTARMLFDSLKQIRPDACAHFGRHGECKRQKQEIGISSLRMGNITGIHEVHICTPAQTLTLRHEAHDRGMFADGAIDAARFIAEKAPGLYTMAALLEEA